jgi:clan AA aspartic protease (TIGR02281 family)
MRKRLAAALAVGVTLATGPVLARKNYVPLAGSGQILIVEATLNQRVSGRFILDTGATYCIVSKATAAEANVTGRKDGPKVHMATASGKIVEATLAEARRIEVGNAVARDVQIAVVDVDPAPGFRGLIGLSFLRNFKYSVDADAKELLLEN